MPLLIDTYNVLHTTGVLPPEMAGIDIGGLIQLISASRYRNQLVTLVCDGTGPMPSSPGLPRLIAVRFAGPGREADDLILELRESLGTTVVIVTHELASIFAISDNSVFLDPVTKTQLAIGNPNELRDRHPNFEVRNFLQRGEAEDKAA